MPNLEDAIRLALQAHQGQLDKSGEQPYILHPMRVMFRVQGEVDQMVAILHDVVEDSETTLADLRDMGYSEEVVGAIDAISRREGEAYDEFVTRSIANPIARRIKKADLEDNMDIRRLPGEPTEKDWQRLRRYRRAWDRVVEALEETWTM